jgi:hypothetical protein
MAREYSTLIYRIFLEKLRIFFLIFPTLGFNFFNFAWATIDAIFSIYSDIHAIIFKGAEGCAGGVGSAIYNFPDTSVIRSIMSAF